MIGRTGDAGRKRRRAALRVVWRGARPAALRTRRAGAVRRLRVADHLADARPTPSSSVAYGDWYRPEAGRFSGVGDRAAAPAARRGWPARLDADRPAGPGARRRRRRRGAARCARRARAGRRSGSSATPTAPDVRAAELAELERPLRRGRLLALARAPARRGRRRSSTPRRAARAAAASLVVAMPEPGQPPGAAVRRPLARARPAAPPRPRAGAGADRAAASELGLRVERVSYLRGGQVVFGWLHGIVGSLPGHPDLYDAIRRPEARRAADLGRAGARRRSPPAVALAARPRRCAAAPRPPCGAAAPSTWRLAVAEPDAPEDRRRDAGAATRRRRSRRPSPPSRATGSTRSSWSTTRSHRRDASSSRATLGVHVVWHPHNVGYGGNQKTCYLEALQRGAEIVVMLHPDGQYEPSLIPKLIAPILDGEADLVLGTRMAEPRRGARRRDAALQADRQPRPDDDREPRPAAPISPTCTPATAPTAASCC